VGFRDEDRIFIEYFCVFKGYGTKKLIKEFLNKGRGLQGLNKLLKKLWEKPVRWQDTASAFDHELCKCMTMLTPAFSIFCNIPTQTAVLRKEYVVWLQIYSAAILPYIINLVNIWQSNHKNNK